MKFSALLAIFALTMSLNTAYATEDSGPDDDISSYCKEQADRDGIEDASEKSQFVKECIESYNVPTGENQLGE